jgi:hypothetical protein
MGRLVKEIHHGDRATSRQPPILSMRIEHIYIWSKPVNATNEKRRTARNPSAARSGRDRHLIALVG